VKKASLAKSFLWSGVVCTLAAVLVTLGVLQYRWSREVSDATSARMRAGLAAAMSEFRRGFFGELANVARAFPVDAADSLDPRRCSIQLAQWEKTAAHPALIQDVYIWHPEPGKPDLVKIKSSGQEGERVAWPPELVSLREDLPPNSVFQQAFSGGPPQVLGFRAPEVYRHRKDGPVEFELHRVPVGGEAIGLATGNVTGIFKGGPPWMLKSSVPALVRPIASASREINRGGLGYQAILSGWMIIVLNRAVVSEHIFPELTTRYFSGIDGLDYDVAIIAGDNPERAIYSSNPGAARTTLAGADASMELLEPLGVPGRAIISTLPKFKGQPESAMLATPNFGSAPGHSLEADLREESWAIAPMPTSPSESWWLVVSNRQGSVEAAVARLQRRNLGLSFGVLAILAVTMATIILTSRRAQELARLQMEFVAGVSHELRTPLTVISSAADNIADGLVQGSEKITQYGAALKRQAAQLRELVEQILMFSATQQNRQGYSLRSAQMADVVDLALKNSAELIRDANCRVQCEVRRDLPEIMIDVAALSRCLQNLIGNAIKYGGDERWIGIEASTAEGGSTVVISVTDRGIGIRAEDLQHIFEPFYRSAAVRDSQIHGNGLGLSVTRSIVEAMGGLIRVQSAPGRGSSFTIHIPAAGSVLETRKVALRAPARVDVS